MNIYKKLGEFSADEKDLCLSDKVKNQIKRELRSFETEFASDEDNCVILLDRKENLRELYQEFPALEKIRPENSMSIDNYINQVYVTGNSGSGMSVYLSIDPPPLPWRQCF